MVAGLVFVTRSVRSEDLNGGRCSFVLHETNHLPNLSCLPALYSFLLSEIVILRQEKGDSVLATQ